MYIDAEHERRSTPPAAPLEVTVTTGTVRVRGEADLSNEHLVVAALADAITAGTRDVHLDLTGLDFISCRAWRLLLQASEPMRRADGRLHVHLRPDGVVRQVVDVLAPWATPGVVITTSR
ncbi:STAS domain-containing protein [Catellatospora sp. NPDC049133]|uniref:STAS domain-containing protein n=1 Tax=Catellatospora sp. NPDC049133 TaxID=3155499 RepID=UPI0033D08250